MTKSPTVANLDVAGFVASTDRRRARIVRFEDLVTGGSPALGPCSPVSGSIQTSIPSPEARARFYEIAGPQLAKLGYSRDADGHGIVT